MSDGDLMQPLPHRKRILQKEQLQGTVTVYRAMVRIGILHKIEKLIQDKSMEEKYQKQVFPVVDAFLNGCIQWKSWWTELPLLMMPFYIR